jgi:hypothetical protein
LIAGPPGNEGHVEPWRPTRNAQPAAANPALARLDQLISTAYTNLRSMKY